VSKLPENIEIRGLFKAFTVDGREHIVMDDFNLDIPADGITALLGRSGCGKTTLLRLIGGLDRDYRGTIFVPPGGKTAFVFQEARLMPWLTVRKNITFGLKKSDIDSEQIDRLIKLTGLEGFEDAMPGQLSGGMSQRCALARALALEPEFLLMDEPFAALDFFTREKMQRALVDIHENTACGVLLVTHSVDEALTVGDRIVVMEDKKVKKIYDLPDSKAREKDRAEIRKAVLNNIKITGNEVDDYEN
jgi:sulfonate transport system ATP-binding protein